MTIFTIGSMTTKCKSWRLLARRICSIGWGKAVTKWQFKIVRLSKTARIGLHFGIKAALMI
jgi:hypothetical protein